METIISYPATLSFSGNVAPLVVSASGATSFVLKKNGIEMLNEVYFPDNSGKFKVDLKQLIDSTLSIDIPTVNMYQQLNAYATFTIFISNVLVHTFKVVKSGMDGILPAADTFFKGNFLTWQPQDMKVKYQEPQWLTYFATTECRIRVKYYYTLNNAAATQQTTLYTMSTGRCYSLNMKYSHLRGYMNPPTLKPYYIEVWAETLSGEKLSYVQRYQLTDAYDRFDDLFLFENSLGGVDVIRFNGWMENSDEHSVSTAVFNNITKEYELEYHRVFSKNAGYLNTETFRRWALDFFSTINRYHIVNGLNKRILLPKVDTKNTIGELNDFSFDFYYSEEDKYEQYSRLTELPAVETDELTVVPEWVASSVVITTGGVVVKFTNTVLIYKQI
jgi:hypothetical protein